MDDDEALQFWLDEAAHPFSGWDFSHISATGRMASAPLGWSYVSRLLPHLRRARSLLDLGTGGGELLARLQPFPPHTRATEGYPPNLPVARARLEPLGVAVAEVGDDGRLPFADGEFELVIDRHEFYLEPEVFRVLAPGGWFITQQVGHRHDEELDQWLGVPASPDLPWRFAEVAAALTRAGFRVIEQREEFPPTRFYDVGAIVYYLTAIPWQVPGFSVTSHAPALLEIHRRIEADGYVDLTGHYCLLIARKPPAGEP
jgi:SAM-dependent methyltransferase